MKKVNKTIKKKVISIILAVCLLVSVSPAFVTGASAAEKYVIKSADDNWEFYADDENMTAELTLCYITGLYETFEIPKSVIGENGKEYTVDTLGNILNENLNIINLIIPNTVEGINSQAFGFKKTLKTVTVEDGNLPIEFGSCSFYYCDSLEKVDFGNRKTYIYYNCFSSCPSLKSVVLPKNVEYVDFGALNVESAYIYNAKCVLDDNCFDDDTVIYGIENSTSSKYAKNSGCKFKKLVSCSLKSTKYTYNRKNKKPAVIVKDYKGNKVSKNNYTVYYQKDKRSVGQHNVKINLKNLYSGTITKKFTIIPQKTKLLKVNSKENGCTLKWKKKTKETTGYKIQYSTNQRFKNGTKSKTINNVSSTSLKIKNLSKGKNYYFRICTFKTVKVNGKKTKISSVWSSVKSVKII